MNPARGITCRSCRAWIEEREGLRRCPRCGEDLTSRALPDLPVGLEAPDGLQGPAFEARQRAHEATAPASEFIAAGAVVGGIVMLAVGALIGSGTVALVGVLLTFVVLGLAAVRGGSLLRTLDHYRRTLWWPFPGRGRDAGDEEEGTRR